MSDAEDEFDAGGMADVATGDATPEQAVTPVDNGKSGEKQGAEGGSEGVDPTPDPSDSTLRAALNRLFDGTAEGPSVRQVMDEYALERPEAMMARGVARLGSGDRLPPGADLGIGAWLRSVRDGGSSSSESTDEQESGDPDLPDDLGDGV